MKTQTYYQGVSTLSLWIVTMSLAIVPPAPGNEVDYSLFHDEDFRSVQRLAGRLRDARDPLTRYLSAQFSEDTRRLLDVYDGSVGSSKSVREALAAELNRVLLGARLYDAERFAGVRLGEEVATLLKQNVTGDEAVRLNRLLLEAAFPEEIVKSSGLTLGLGLSLHAISDFNRDGSTAPRFYYPDEDITVVICLLNYGRRQVAVETREFDWHKSLRLELERREKDQWERLPAQARFLRQAR